MRKLRGAMKCNENGTVLLSVIIVTTVMMILITAVMTFVGQTSQKSISNYSGNQAYYIASSSLKTFIDYIDDNNVEISSIATNAGVSGNVLINGSSKINGAGSCTISVGYANGRSDLIVARAAATYAGQHYEQVAYFDVVTTSTSRKMSNAIESNKGVSTNLSLSAVGDTVADSTNFTNKTLSFSNQSVIYGSLRNIGNILMDTQPTLGADVKPNTRTVITSTESIIVKNPTISISDPTIVTGNDATTQVGTIACGKYFVSKGNTTLGSDSYVTSGTLTYNTKPTDVFCTIAYLGSASTGDDAMTDANIKNSVTEQAGTNYVQYGNLYCYKTGKTGSVNEGSLICGSGNNTYTPKIYGDVYVEGNIWSRLNNSGLTIYGNLYITRDFTININGAKRVALVTYKGVVPRVICDTSSLNAAQLLALSAQVSANITINGAAATLTPASATVGQFVKVGRALMPTVDIPASTFTYESVENILGNVNGVSNGDATFKNYTTEKSTIKANLITAKTTVTAIDSAYRSDFKYYTKESCYLNLSGDGNVFVDVDAAGKDIILLLPDSLNLQNGKNNIIVKNTSGAHFCYLITDKATSTAVPTININQCQIMSYDTYKNFTKLKNGTMAIYSGAYCDDATKTQVNAYNAYTVGSTTYYGDVYTPPLSRIVMMFHSGSKVTVQNSGVLIEALLYGPSASINFASATDMYAALTIDTTNKKVASKAKMTVGLVGASIFGDYTFSDGKAILYNEPAPDSIIQVVNGGGSRSVSTFDHYEMR
ncbi:MAG: hypothetical protein QM689_05280 [Oscillospiraceae bacterium]